MLETAGFIYSLTQDKWAGGARVEVVVRARIHTTCSTLWENKWKGDMVGLEKSIVLTFLYNLLLSEKDIRIPIRIKNHGLYLFGQKKLPVPRNLIEFFFFIKVCWVTSHIRYQYRYHKLKPVSTTGTQYQDIQNNFFKF